MSARQIRPTAALLLLALAGCGSSNGLTLAPVTGKVTMDGKPVQNGTVIFEPDESKGTTGPQAIGTIKSDGTYILSSESAADGAVVGHHRVGVLGMETEPIATKAAPAPSPEEDPLKFLAAKTKAGMEAARAATKKNAERTVTGLDGKTFRIVTPEKVSSTQTSGIAVEVERGSNSIDIHLTEDGAEIKK